MLLRSRYVGLLGYVSLWTLLVCMTEEIELVDISHHVNCYGVF